MICRGSAGTRRFEKPPGAIRIWQGSSATTSRNDAPPDANTYETSDPPMPERFKARILQHLSHEKYTPSLTAQLAEDLGVDEADMDEFQTAVAQLADAGQVLVSEADRIALPPLGDELVGVFRRNPRGFGFVIPQDPKAHGDLFIPPDSTLDGLTGDIVRAKVRRKRGRPGGPKFEHVGEIVEIIERKQSSFSGEVRKTGGQWLIFPDGKALTNPVIVRDPAAKNAHEGDKVVFELVVHPEGSTLGEGVIIKVLGAAGEPDVETQAVIEAYGLPGEFPEACIEQTREVTETFEEEVERIVASGRVPEDREDLRDQLIITIDPPDAKDFDDALSIARTSGGWRLGVHIADVSTFIKQGTPLDEEATIRGNSCYLPRLVIPMLPELLSNGICSLQEGVPRYCKTAFIQYDDDGNVSGQGFASTLIKSAKRMTYLEAQALIDGDIKEARKHAKTEPHYTDEIIDALKMMNTLSQRIRDRRRKRGMIHLELPDVELIFDDTGRVIDAEPEDNAYTHTLIEMFMVEANEAVARLFEDLGVPLLRRVHPEPTPGEFGDLHEFVKVAGYRIPKSPTREELQSLLDATAGTPAAPAVHFAVLRTLTKAIYSPNLIGHFALASDAYAHFTSPIRRYPDLTVHRALGEYLEHTKNGRERPQGAKEKRALGLRMRDAPNCPDEQTLREIGMRCGRTEDAAEGAERELRNFLVMQLLAEHIGAEFPGVVTGVSNAGVFVRLDKYLVEGLVRSEDLPVPPNRPGRWRIDPRSGALAHEGSGRSYRMGDRVAVIIGGVDLSRRQMELLISDEEAKKREGVGKALKLGGGAGGGGLESTGAAGFDKVTTGAQRRSKKSKSRDKNKSKKDHRAEQQKKRRR
ncbi:MAG: VacB/RNase II family 3'-5' exoribonuclease [Phycisphaeraceae bacterium]|nr:MAG: VacB/RNase II family 3'-5' exoribonuclease [Phycisphaeraceae bacterium]